MYPNDEEINKLLSVFSLDPYLTDDFILVTEMRGRHIHQVSLDGRTVQLPIPSLNPMAATYDPYIHKVFWVSQGDLRVMSSYLNGTELRLIRRLARGKSQLSYRIMMIILLLLILVGALGLQMSSRINSAFNLRLQPWKLLICFSFMT